MYLEPQTKLLIIEEGETRGQLIINQKKKSFKHALHGYDGPAGCLWA